MALLLRFKCLVMKRGSVIVEYQDLETHPCGRRSDDKFLSLDFIENLVQRFLVFGQPKPTEIIGNQLVSIGFGWPNTKKPAKLNSR